MRAKKVCSENAPVPCGEPAVRDGRCAVHARERDAARGTRHQRGYGSVHTRATAALRARWVAETRRGVPWTCPRCHGPLVPGQAVDGDHWGTTPPAAPDRLSHAACNRAKRLPDPPSG